MRVTPPPYIVMFASALRSRQIARLLRRTDSPEARSGARTIEIGAKFRLRKAEEMLEEDRRTRGDASNALSPAERLLVKAEYCRQLAEWLGEAPRAAVETRKIVTRLTAVADFLQEEAHGLTSRPAARRGDGTIGSA